MIPSIVCWLWQDSQHRVFLPEHVNVLHSMLTRHMSIPFRLICVTDYGHEDFIPEVELLYTPEDAKALSRLRSPEGDRFPSCYRRLWAFSKDATILGERCLFTDIDIVVMKDLAPLFKHTSDFVGWRPYRDWGNRTRFGGGTYLLTPGTRTHVWENFKGADSIGLARGAGFRGSDQAWLSYCLASVEPYFPMDAGVYSVRDLKHRNIAPRDALLVHFNGNAKPWQSEHQWVKENWK